MKSTPTTVVIKATIAENVLPVMQMMKKRRNSFPIRPPVANKPHMYAEKDMADRP